MRRARQPLPEHLLRAVLRRLRALLRYLTLAGEKISKSGLALDPLELVGKHGSDAVRYYLLRHVRTDRDGDFDPERFATAHDAELANGLGNLANRLFGALQRITGGSIPPPGPEELADAQLRGTALALPAKVDAAVARSALDEALAAIFSLVDDTNRYLTSAAPWRLAANGSRERASSILRTALEALNVIAWEIGPFLPTASAELRTRLGSVAGSGWWNGLPTGAQLSPGAPLFPRINV